MEKSKTILITGVSSGIGYGATQELLKRGYRVFGSVRKEDDAKRLQSELGEKFFPLIFDVTNQAAIDKAVIEVRQQLDGQGLGGLINNSGITVSGPILDISVEKFIHNFDVNVFGLIRTTKAFLPLLGAQANHPSAPGKILNMSSIAGKMTPPFMSPYVGTKHAVEGISHVLRKELLRFGIEVIIIGPGAVQTPIWDKESLDAYKDSVYFKSLAKFFGWFVHEGKKGMPLEECSRRIADIFETEKPKTRYALVQKKFQSWTLPQLLPDRVIDNFFKKMM
jgi:short-subunit dehydrogenase